MKLDPLPLLGGFYLDDNRPWSAQDACNSIPRVTEKEGTIAGLKTVGAPGLKFLADIDLDPVRIGGIHNVEGRLFVVAGTTLYEVATNYTATVRGTIPGAGPVTMEHNQLEFGNELSIGNGSGNLYVWNTWLNTFTVVSDPAATGSVQTVYLNRRLIHLDPFGRFGYPSDIDDALSYDSLDRFDSEASPDKFVGLGVSQFELVGFSQRTIEFYEDTGATEQPFRPKKIAINRGTASRTSIVQIGGTLAWLGDDGIFYRLQGYEAVPISTGPVNAAIAKDNWSRCFGTVWEDRKHEVAYWTFPDGQTWGWDAWTGMIHRRESFGMNRWRVNAIASWNGLWVAGDFQRGRLYAIDWDTYHENGAPLVKIDTLQPIYNNGNKVVLPRLELQFDTGRGLPDPLGLSGNLPDGIVNVTQGTMQYVVSGGIGGYTYSIVSGALPTGATLNPSSGLVTYDYTAGGNFAWTVRVEDAFGETFDLADTATVGEITWDFTWTFTASGNWLGQGAMAYSPDLSRLVYTEGVPASTVPDYTNDGLSWLSGSPDLTAKMAVAWSPKLQMFAGGRDGTGAGTTVRSTDGITWTLGANSGNFYGAFVMCWADDLEVFFGLGGGTGGAFTGWRKSVDGVNWTNFVIGSSGPGDARALARGAGVYVAVSTSNESVLRRIMWSANGDTWTPVGTFNTSFFEVRWIPEKSIFIATGNNGGLTTGKFVVTSPDGKVWTDVTPTGIPSGVQPYGIEFVPELDRFVLTTNTATASLTTFYTSPFPLSSGGWTGHPATFPGGNMLKLRWMGAPDYRLVVLSVGGAGGTGWAYSNTILVTPP